MSDIIHLLPDSVANQIAAGEVIQRPASVVKELLENSVDAGATNIKLIVKDAGKTLLQVIDNGCGMSETDARMCFERHATSKIKKADDLFAIRTMGFRGEAMASIAAISQVEMKTKRMGDELGVKLEIEASNVISHEACNTPNGTIVSVKNIFFNVPARRKFLKTDSIEMRHIIDEFQHVAFAYPSLVFSLYHNDNDVFLLEKGTFRQRILGLCGKNYNEKLVPVEEETTLLKISGFIGKPEFAKKVRGDQFFFANNRFIKNAYLHHAVANAFQGLIAPDYHPAYFLNFTLDPGSIDINIHPAKTEIKFEDEKAVYSIIRAAVKQSLGKYNISPSLDFTTDNSFEITTPRKNDQIKFPQIRINPEFDPFKKTTPLSSSGAGYINHSSLQGEPTGGKMDWEKMFNPESPSGNGNNEKEYSSTQTIKREDETTLNFGETDSVAAFQFHGKFIMSQIKSGMMVIHQQRAHERILFEKFLMAAEQNKGMCQQLLFPQNVEFSTHDFDLIKELSPEVSRLGFDLGEFGKNTLIIRGIPVQAGDADAKVLLEKMLEIFKSTPGSLLTERADHPPGKSENNRNYLAFSLAKLTSVKTGKKLQKEEMISLIDELFACEMPYVSPSGKPTLITISLEDMDKKFQ